MVMTFSERLKAAREYAKLTQKDLALRVGLKQPTIAGLEKTGEGSMKTTEIAAACGVSAKWLASGIGTMLPPQQNTLLTTVQNNSNNSPPLAPVIAWARVGELLMKPNEDFREGPQHPAAIGAGERFKWVIAGEDMPAFGILAGHHMAMDPVGDSFVGVERKVYLFATATGYHFLGRFRGLPGGAFEAVSAAGDVYNSAQHGLVLLARFRGALEP